MTRESRGDRPDSGRPQRTQRPSGDKPFQKRAGPAGEDRGRRTSSSNERSAPGGRGRTKSPEQNQGERSFGKRSFGGAERSSGAGRPYAKREGSLFEKPERRPAENREGRPYERKERRPAESREGRPYERRVPRTAESREGRPYERRVPRTAENSEGRPYERRVPRTAESREGRPYERRVPRTAENSEGRPFERRELRPAEKRESRLLKKREGRSVERSGSRPFEGHSSRPRTETSNPKNLIRNKGTRPSKGQLLKELGFSVGHNYHTESRKATESHTEEKSELIRLNKFVANAGVCSRREADTYITAGVVKVNGQVVTELGSKVSPDDEIRFDGRLLTTERKVYILLNKPKDYVTTTDDPHAEQTVMDLVKDACSERIYPVGRLDRNTTGLLLLTNDGDLSKKLTHPSHKMQKVYQVTLDKMVSVNDLQKIGTGIELEDGLMAADAISFVEGQDKSVVGIEIHSGRHRVVRRIFESLGYRVRALDRVSYAGLTKKNIPRGKWRFLSPREVGFLKMK